MSTVQGFAGPPAVVASVHQTGLNLMRDLRSKGVRVFGVDWDTENPGFRSRYGECHACPNPDTHPQAWVEFMVSLARRIGGRPVLIAAADEFVSAIGSQAPQLRDAYVFSEDGVRLQAEFATKERQYALVRECQFPAPVTEYVHCRADVARFAAASRFPCVLKPRHEREWLLLPSDHVLRERKLAVAEEPVALVDAYASIEPHQPHALVQEAILGPDHAKFCYVAAYAGDGRRLGHCVVRELRTWPPGFGSASVVESVLDEEIEALCDGFLSAIGYVGLVEMEMKRDSRDGRVKLIELNPRFSVTGDCARYLGVEVAWLHYCDLVGRTREAPSYRLGRRHVTLIREARTIPECVRRGELSLRQLAASYRLPLNFFDVDLEDPRVTAENVYRSARALASAILRGSPKAATVWRTAARCEAAPAARAVVETESRRSDGSGSAPRVTFVLTHYNRPRQLKTALDSVLRQTRPADEIVIVDDASPEAARSAVAELASVATLRFNTRNLGPSGARNVGLACATGDWVAFLDDDDECLPDRLERQLAYVASHPGCEFVGGGVWRVTADDRKDYWGETRTGPKSTREVLEHTAAMAPTMLVRRETLLRVGGFRSRLRSMEDFELGIRLSAAGIAPHFLAEPLILYHKGHDQATAHWFRMLTSHLAVVAMHHRVYRRELGPFGTLQMMARVCRMRGLSHGALVGRAIWALGQSVFLAFGDRMGPLD